MNRAPVDRVRPVERGGRRRPTFPHGLAQMVCRRCHKLFGVCHFRCPVCHEPLQSTQIYNVPPKPRR